MLKPPPGFEERTSLQPLWHRCRAASIQRGGGSARIGGFEAGFSAAMPPVHFQNLNLNAGLMPFQSRAPEGPTGFYVYVSANLGTVGSGGRRASPLRVPKP